MNLGDYDFGSTVFLKFTTVNSTGAPAALSSAGITVYRNGSTVPDTTGVALTASFNGVTGLNHVTVGMSTAGFYSSAGSFMAIISSGAATEDLAGYVVGHWSVRSRFSQVSTAVAISTASVIASVASITSTVQADVALWRGFAPSTLGINSHLQISTGSLISTAQTMASVAAVTSTVQADVALWRGFAPSTLGPNSHIQVSTAQVFAGVVTLTAISTTAALQINAEVVDALATDTYAEPAAGAPTHPASFATKLGTLYASHVQGMTMTASGKTFLNGSSAVKWVKGVSGSSLLYTETRASTST